MTGASRSAITVRLWIAASWCVTVILGLSVTVAQASGVRSPPSDPVASAPSHRALYVDGPTDRYLLDGVWLYRSDHSDVGVNEQWFADTATGSWTRIAVPQADNATNLSTAGDAGMVAWYRRDFTAPPRAFPSDVPSAQRRWIVRLEEVNYRATVWLNGQFVGTHAGTSLPFELTLPRLRPGINRLIVRVDNRRTAADLPPGNGGWWNYGGLLREVYLRAVAGVDLSQLEVTPTLRCSRCAATVSTQATVRNLSTSIERVRLVGRFGGQTLDLGSASLPPGATWTPHTTTLVHHPRLWSIEHPVLYPVSLTLTDAQGRALGGYHLLSGIRSVGVTADGRLTLNGRTLHLRGVEVREQSAIDGDALTPAQLSHLVGSVRQLGATLIRDETPNPELEELADRDGLLIWSDIPVSGLSSPLLANSAWLARAHALLRQDIEDNSVHPSILLWSIANELQTPPSTAEASYIASTTALARALDPTRPVGMAISDWPGIACQAAYAPLQVIGVNEYFGWYDAGGGATDDRDQLSPFLDSLHQCYPHQAIMVSEFGFEANRSGPVEERGTYQFQADAARFHLGVFAIKRWLSGAIYFCLQDAAVSPGFAGGNPWPDPPFLEKGLIDRRGQRKPAFAVVGAIYRRTAQISPRPTG